MSFFSAVVMTVAGIIFASAMLASGTITLAIIAGLCDPGSVPMRPMDWILFSFSLTVFVLCLSTFVFYWGKI